MISSDRLIAVQEGEATFPAGVRKLTNLYDVPIKWRVSAACLTERQTDVRLVSLVAACASLIWRRSDFRAALPMRQYVYAVV